MDQKDLADIVNNQWLTDKHMSAATNNLKSVFPHIDGLEDTVLQQNNSWTIPTSEFVQVITLCYRNPA